MIDQLEWLVAALPALVLVLTVYNLLVWPRGLRGEPQTNVSVLIPARNEQATIRVAVESALREPVMEVVVYDDDSTDDTGAILADIAASDERLRVLRGSELPRGWVGKPHACHRLSEAARGDVLFFMDADVELLGGALRRTGDLFARYEADMVTAVPRQRMGTLAEKMIIPLLHVTYASWLPLSLIWRADDPRFLAANGQVLAVRRGAYESVGGFESVRDAVLDDMAIARRFKEEGHTVMFADGFEIATCRMYSSLGEVWEGFSKNIYEGLGSAPALFAVLALYFSTFVLPWLLLPAALTGLASADLLAPSIAGVMLNVVQRLFLTVRFRHPLSSIALHPIANFFLGAIALNSWRWHLKDAVSWSGRNYARKEARDG